jgi:hypothetical protein
MDDGKRLECPHRVSTMAGSRPIRYSVFEDNSIVAFIANTLGVIRPTRSDVNLPVGLARVWRVPSDERLLFGSIPGNTRRGTRVNIPTLCHHQTLP